MEKLIKKGAEASIYREDWFGMPAIRKIRVPKSFRQSTLDIKIRESRTRHEASFLSEAKSIGVITPLVYFVNVKQAEIVMQFIDGIRLKEIIDKSDDHKLKKWCKLAGKYIARLHAGEIIHGDLTTSNFIISNDQLILIDFGLSFYSQRIEDKAIDIHLLKMVSTSAHSLYTDMIMDSVLSGYQEVAGELNSYNLIKRLNDIDLRGRYK